MISWTLEMRPRIRARKKDYELIDEKQVEEEDKFVTLQPDLYSDEYDEFTDSIKTAIVLESWMNETTEEKMLEEHNVTPGELNAKLERADWLLYASYELSKLQGHRKNSELILKTRMRLSNGVKEELLALLKLKNVGRIRARKMFSNSIKTLSDVKKVDISTLAQILGRKIAVDVKKQVGQEFSEDKIQIKPNKRKGQISLHDF
jgi:helicase